MTKLLLPLFVGLILGFLSYHYLKPQHKCPTIQTTLTENDPGHIRFFNNRIKKLEWKTADGTISHFSLNVPQSPNQNLVITANEPLSIPDDHGFTVLRLIDVNQDKATIAYADEFHHGSFGNNLITIDCGTVQLDIVKLP